MLSRPDFSAATCCFAARARQPLASCRGALLLFHASCRSAHTTARPWRPLASSTRIGMKWTAPASCYRTECLSRAHQVEGARNGDYPVLWIWRNGAALHHRGIYFHLESLVSYVSNQNTCNCKRGTNRISSSFELVTKHAVEIFED